MTFVMLKPRTFSKTEPGVCNSGAEYDLAQGKSGPSLTSCEPDS